MHALFILATMLSSFVQHPPRIEHGTRPWVSMTLTHEASHRLVEGLHLVLGPPDDTRWGNEWMWRRGDTAICYVESPTRTLPHASLVVAPDCWNS